MNFHELKTFANLRNYLSTKVTHLKQIGKALTSYKQGQREQKDIIKTMSYNKFSKIY